MMDISKVPTSKLVHDYLESYMDIARCELLVASTMVSDKTQTCNHRALALVSRERLEENRRIVKTIVEELARRDDETLFDRRELILGEFSI